MLRLHNNEITNTCYKLTNEGTSRPMSNLIEQLRPIVNYFVVKH